MNAIEMIRKCYYHQHPEEYGRTEIAPTPVVYGPGDSATGFSAHPISEYCARCDVNHGVPWSIYLP